MISIDQIINEICEVKGRLMNNKGIVKYIEHYMHKDISKGAVMLITVIKCTKITLKKCTINLQ